MFYPQMTFRMRSRTNPEGKSEFKRFPAFQLVVELHNVMSASEAHRHNTHVGRHAAINELIEAEIIRRKGSRPATQRTSSLPCDPKVRYRDLSELNSHTPKTCFFQHEF
jgi:hypothetical protein